MSNTNIITTTIAAIIMPKLQLQRYIMG